MEYLDPELYDRLKKLVSGTKAKVVVDVDQDADHLYFCYRWFLLDFKREFPPEMVLPTALIIETLNTTKVFTVWEMAWAAREVTSTSLPVFIAYSILQLYRSVSSMFTCTLKQMSREKIIEFKNFSDILRYFNDLQLQLQATTVLTLARRTLLQLAEELETKKGAS